MHDESRPKRVVRGGRTVPTAASRAHAANRCPNGSARRAAKQLCMPSEDVLKELLEWGRSVGEKAGLTEEKLEAIRKSARRLLHE